MRWTPIVLQDTCHDRAALARRLRAAQRSHVHDAHVPPKHGTAIYTLADPRDLRAACYVGQTRDPRRRFAQHVSSARLWLPDEPPWWIRSPRYRPLYEWLRALYRDGGRLPVLSVLEWLDADADALAAERAAIVGLLAEGAPLRNVEARRGPQLPLL